MRIKFKNNKKIIYSFKNAKTTPSIKAKTVNGTLISKINNYGKKFQKMLKEQEPKIIFSYKK